MTWTYTSDPMNEPVDEIRFLVGDTDDAEHLVQDEEIAYHLSLYPKPVGKPAYLAGAAVAEAIAAQFARRADRSIGSLQISAKQQRDHYVELAAQLRLAWATDGKGTASNTLRMVPAGPTLSGGGKTYLGENTIPSGGGMH
jgi:hypothetical protein